MGFEGKGISKLSELMIDADKDWQGKGISNIKELAAGMAIGDMLIYDGTRIIKLQPGPVGRVLTSQGPGALPIWAPGGGGLPFSTNIIEYRCDPDDPPVEREKNTIYQNTTGRPMFVTVDYVVQCLNVAPTVVKESYCFAYISTDGGANFFAQGKQIGQSGSVAWISNQTGAGSWGIKHYDVVSFIVPPNYYYQIVVPGYITGTFAFFHWIEID